MIGRGPGDLGRGRAGAGRGPRRPAGLSDRRSEPVEGLDGGLARRRRRRPAHQPGPGQARSGSGRGRPSPTRSPGPRPGIWGTPVDEVRDPFDVEPAPARLGVVVVVEQRRGIDRRSRRPRNRAPRPAARLQASVSRTAKKSTGSEAKPGSPADSSADSPKTRMDDGSAFEHARRSGAGRSSRRGRSSGRRRGATPRRSAITRTGRIAASRRPRPGSTCRAAVAATAAAAQRQRRRPDDRDRQLAAEPAVAGEVIRSASTGSARSRPAQ